MKPAKELLAAITGVWVALLLPEVAAAQSPVGPEVRVTDRQMQNFASGLVYTSNNTLVAGYQENVFEFPNPDPISQGVILRRLSPAGDLSLEEEVVRFGENGFLNFRALLAFPDGTVEALYDTQGEDARYNLSLVQFDAEGRRFAESFLPRFFFVTAAERGGNLALVGGPDSPELVRLLFSLYSPDGKLLRRPRRLAKNSADAGGSHKIATDSAGQTLVVWVRGYDTSPPYQRFDLRARAIDRSGAFGPDFQINARSGYKVDPVVASGAGGTFWVAWRDGDLAPGGSLSIRAQRVTPDGARVGREIQVTSGRPDVHRNPAIAADPFGNVLITWFQDSFDPSGYGCRGRLYRSDGTPVGKPFSLARSGRVCGGIPLAAFDRNGIFATIWPRGSSDPEADPGRWDLYITRFSASPADEVCWVRAGHLLCDTGRTGGEAEIDETIPEGAGSQVWMADVDGDGRADPCVLVGSELRCDVDHEGQSLSWRRPVTVPPGATLLLGDVDGDGKADPCTWQAGEFRCATQAGPTLVTHFGQAGDVPLLGDLDGDGRADLCVRRGNEFLCDTGHDGGAPERTIAFGLSSDVPALGDFDGDGRADPCVLRRGWVLCDTRHDGGLAEGRLKIAIRPGEPLLIANLDGL